MSGTGGGDAERREEPQQIGDILIGGSSKQTFGHKRFFLRSFFQDVI
jgi:hypothetical protein